MRLKSAKLRNFRCFDELEVQFHPRLTVLVADNGGGKTALLDGVAVGLSPILGNLSSASQRLSGHGIEDSDFRLVGVEAARGEDRWVAADHAQVVLEASGGLTWDVWRPSAGSGPPPTKVGQTDLARHLQAVLESLKTPRPNLLPVVAYYGARRGWIVIPERLRGRKAGQIDYTQPTSALVGALDSLTDFKEMLRWFDVEEAAELRANKPALGEMFDHLERSPRLEAVRSAITTILGAGYTNPHFNERHKFVVETKSDPKILQVSQLSQGYQSMLALGMDFARRLAIANPVLDDFFAGHPEWEPSVVEYVAAWKPEQVAVDSIGPAWAPAVMLVDEIDLHLHPSWQQRVLGDLMRAFPGTQFIVTTHSPQVLSTVKTENIRILERDSEGRWTASVPDASEVLGVESSMAMRDIMRVDPTPFNDVVASRSYRDYLNHIESGTQESPKALELRRELSELYGARHPLMLDADRLLRFQGYKRRASPQAND